MSKPGSQAHHRSCAYEPICNGVKAWKRRNARHTSVCGAPVVLTRSLVYSKPTALSVWQPFDVDFRGPLACAADIYWVKYPPRTQALAFPLDAGCDTVCFTPTSPIHLNTSTIVTFTYLAKPCVPYYLNKLSCCW